MVEYLDINRFINMKADLLNFVNPFFDEKYRISHNFNYILLALYKYKNYLDNLFCFTDASIKLDINQKIVILTQNKNILVLAGAGSGKTTTIAAKIRFMIEILRIDPQDICLISYTNYAVLEMCKIIKGYFNIDINILTFHKFAIKLLNNKRTIVERIDFTDLIQKYSFFPKFLLFSYLYLFYNVQIKDFNERFSNKLINAFEDFQDDCNKKYYENKIIKKRLMGLTFYINYKYYQMYLKKEKEVITFDQLIEEACLLNKYRYNFKYLIIDEYQDISNQRLRFISKYLKVENAKLMGVGDDWQTIFSFASSNISNILDFQNKFIDVRILKILMTYRNCQQLIDVAGQFVMKTSYQIKKALKSSKSIQNPIIFVKYTSRQEKVRKIVEILKKIYEKEGVKVAFLLRYNNEINEILDNENFIMCADKLYFQNSKQIFYHTVHTAKGLGFDYVFILNNTNTYYGFPSNRKQRSVFKEEKTILEERRLYYVALTRTKNIVYILEPKKHISKFLKEIKNILKKNNYLV